MCKPFELHSDASSLNGLWFLHTSHFCLLSLGGFSFQRAKWMRWNRTKELHWTQMTFGGSSSQPLLLERLVSLAIYFSPKKCCFIDVLWGAQASTLQCPNWSGATLQCHHNDWYSRLSGGWHTDRSTLNCQNIKPATACYILPRLIFFICVLYS